MKIIVASQSQVKLYAVRNALANLKIDAEVVGVKAVSGVAEQPIDDETLQGAKNRCNNARAFVPDADMYIAIENGIYTQPDGRYIDKAVIFATTNDGRETITMSEGVEFPKAAVEEARRRGFARTTVGQVMQEQGLVAKHDDPHLSLIGKSRSTILTEAVSELLSQTLKWSKPRTNGPNEHTV